MSPDIIRPGDAARRRSEDSGNDESNEEPDVSSASDSLESEYDEEIEFTSSVDEEDFVDEEENSLDADDEPDGTEQDDFFSDSELNEDEGDSRVGGNEVTSEKVPSFVSPAVPKAKKSKDTEASLVQESVIFSDSEEASSSHAKREGFYHKLYYGRTRIDFVRRRRIWFAISLIVIFSGIISLSTRGLNLGIDFSGGTSWQVRTATVTPAEARTALSPLGYAGATITVLGSNAATKTLQVEAKLGNGQSPNQTQVARVTDTLARLAGVNPEAVGVDSVGPSWGSSVTDKAIEALIVFFIVVSLYISIFFEWRMAMAAVLAVIHDVMVVIGIYSLTGLQVTPDTVVAILTILGYSLYDTIVVFDRVRDNVSHIGSTGRLSISDIVNLSMNQTLARSINTSLVAILPILSVLILGADILGAQTLQYFGWALLIGLLSGAYSSIFIASPIVALLKEKEPKYRTVRERLQARGLDRQVYSASAVAKGLLVADQPGRVRPSRPTTRVAANASGRSVSKGTGTGEASGQRESSSKSASPKPSQNQIYRPKASARSRRKGRQR
jgi:preprotein translocase subunit SecF